MTAATPTSSDVTRVGLISDTHGMLRPEALARLQGCLHILHAGDICEASVLEQLAAIAPVTAVRGNNDVGDWARTLELTVTLALGGVGMQVIHDIGDLRRMRLAPDVRVVVYGHSHKPAVAERDGVLYVNPGSAGPRRFSLPISVGELRIENGAVSAHLHTLG